MARGGVVGSWNWTHFLAAITARKGWGLSVPSMVGLMMGTWFLASGAGNAVAALVAQATAAPGPDGEPMVLDVYRKVGQFAIGAGAVLAAASPFLSRLMHLDSLSDDARERVRSTEG